MRRWSAQLLFEPRDAWIGLYWDRPFLGYARDGQMMWELRLYICLVPFFPLLLTKRLW